MTRTGFLLLMCLFGLVSKLTNGQKRRFRRTEDSRMAILENLLLNQIQKMSSMEKELKGIHRKLNQGNLKMTSFETQLNEIRTNLTELSAGARIPGATNLAVTSELLENNLNGIQAGLVAEKEQRLNLENMVKEMKDELRSNYRNNHCLSKVKILEGNTTLLQERIGALELAYAPCLNSSRCGQSDHKAVINGKTSAGTEADEPVTVVRGVQFSGKPINFHNSRVFYSCRDVWNSGYRDKGVYRLNIIPGRASLVVCSDQWMAVLRREEGKQDFNKTWIEYKEGFGNLESEFWIGNDLLWHAFNSSLSGRSTKMYVDLYYNNEHCGTEYDRITMSKEGEGYRMDYQRYRDYSDIPESFKPLSIRGTFMTKDRQSLGPKCPTVQAGWWYEDYPQCTTRFYIPTSEYWNLAVKQTTNNGYPNKASPTQTNSDENILLTKIDITASF